MFFSVLLIGSVVIFEIVDLRFMIVIELNCRVVVYVMLLSSMIFLRLYWLLIGLVVLNVVWRLVVLLVFYIIF